MSLQSSLSVAAVLLLLLVSLEAGIPANLDTPVEDLTTDMLESLQSSHPHLRQVRQDRQLEESAVHQIQRINCTTNQSCYPEEYQSDIIPFEFIHCSADGFCMCSDCFVRLHDVCSVAECHSYQPSELECEDKRRSQKTAFLLSVFLSSVGAANFYIADHKIAFGQMALFIVLMVSVCSLICFPCWMLVCMDEDDFDDAIEGIAFICFVILMVLLGLLSILAIFCWWVADLVIFVQNGRNAGDGCPLKPDL